MSKEQISEEYVFDSHMPNQVTLDAEQCATIVALIERAIDPIEGGISDEIYCNWDDETGKFTLCPNYCTEGNPTTYYYGFRETVALWQALSTRKFTQATLTCHRWGCDVETYFEY